MKNTKRFIGIVVNKMQYMEWIHRTRVSDIPLLMIFIDLAENTHSIYCSIFVFVWNVINQSKTNLNLSHKTTLNLVLIN